MSTGQDSRGTPAIDVRFDRPDRRYDPGNPLRIRYRIGGLEPDTVRAVEVSVAWYTEGKGEEDLFVHAFERLVDAEAVQVATGGCGFETTLPVSPVSYEGVIVKIRWCVRVRVFHAASRDYVSEHVFEMGSIPPARPPAPTVEAA